MIEAEWTWRWDPATYKASFRANNEGQCAWCGSDRMHVVEAPTDITVVCRACGARHPDADPVRRLVVRK